MPNTLRSSLAHASGYHLLVDPKTKLRQDTSSLLILLGRQQGALATLFRHRHCLPCSIAGTSHRLFAAYQRIAGKPVLPLAR
jgi:hypothetical protein